jgi:hypothetical protein
MTFDTLLDSIPLSSMGFWVGLMISDGDSNSRVVMTEMVVK